MHDDFSALRQYFKGYADIGCRNNPQCFFRPFDEENVVSVELIAKTCGFPFVFIVQPI